MEDEQIVRDYIIDCDAASGLHSSAVHDALSRMGDKLREYRSEIDKLRTSKPSPAGKPIDSDPHPPVDRVTRYCLAGDNSGHEYYIPFHKTHEWNEWIDLDGDDERSWETPKYATRIDGRFTFTDPKCD